MLAVTWANDTRGKSVFWLHAAVRRGISPSVDDQLGITPRHRQILLATFSRPEATFPQLMTPFQATRQRNLGLERDQWHIDPVGGGRPVSRVEYSGGGGYMCGSGGA
jgi:hypothetical protein